jgi:Thioesterase domain
MDWEGPVRIRKIPQPHLIEIVIMTVLRQFFIAATVCGAICFGATHQNGGSAAAQTTAQNTPTASQVQVDLLRGLADIFSRGMDTLTEKLNQQGYSARVYSTHGWQSVAQRIADKYSRGHKDIIVIIGHSLGANATFDIANELDRRNIPIELIVTFDATRPQPVPKNVLHLVNFYQENGFGKKVSPGSEFKGELTNIDLTADTGLSHATIDKSPRLHAMVMKRIEDVVNKDLAKKIQVNKRKTKRAK